VFQKRSNYLYYELKDVSC